MRDVRCAADVVEDNGLPFRSDTLLRVVPGALLAKALSWLDARAFASLSQLSCFGDGARRDGHRAIHAALSGEVMAGDRSPNDVSDPALVFSRQYLGNSGI